MRSIVESFGFTFIVLNLDDLFSSSRPASEQSVDLSSHITRNCYVDLADPNLPIKMLPNEMTLSPLQKPIDPLENILRPLTKTSQCSMIQNLTSAALLKFCKNRTRNKVLIKTTTSTQMAIDTLLAVSLGNGWSLDQQIGASSYIDGVLVCRPLAQIADAELRQYSKLMEVNTQLPAPHHSTVKKLEIPSLITDFVIKLEENYPMTSAVINQTVNKIGKTKSSSSSLTARTCTICQLSSDPKANQWKHATTLASHDQSNANPNQDRRKLIEVGSETPKEQNPLGLLKDQICYSCLVMFNDHQYLKKDHQQGSDFLDWVQLPDYCYQSLIEPSDKLDSQIDLQNGPSPSDDLQSVLDEFLIKD